MDYQQTLDYLYNNLPAFHRIGGQAYKANLDSIEALDEYLGHPHRDFRTIHIAGTNGKGSVSGMTASVLQAAEYRVGLYTSPHLKDFRERITIDGEMIPRDEVTDFVARLRKKIEEIRPSFFEVMVAMAFDYFSRSKVDIAVIEVGMGGRLDATNIITPILSVITNISPDHMQFLGNTLPEIAREKAGIIKNNIPVVVGETDPQTAPVFIDRSRETGSSIVFADQRYRCTGHHGRKYHIFNLLEDHSFDIELGMEGDYQQKNLCTALAVFDIIGEIGRNPIELNENQVRRGLADTKIRGRWETISENPRVIVDTGHNAEGLRYVAEQLKKQKYRKLYFVIGVVADKELNSILLLLPKEAYFIFTQASLPRAMNYEDLAAKATEGGLEGEAVPTVPEALHRAKELAGPEDLIFVGGSTFTVAEIL